ncbi:MAG: fatty acid--CoA ligase family protein [bacterium]|nr:fatty acid--CoA ligase family protein [bacterium]
MNNLFWIDHDEKKTYHDLINDLNGINFRWRYIRESVAYKVFLFIIHSLVNDYPIVLLDGDFSDDEIINNGFSLEEIINKENIHSKTINSFDDIKKCFNNLNNWSITLLTSGTTGIPKKITHSYQSITKAVKVSDTHREDTWGFAYNPTHMAGIQVLFQALLNANPMVNLFRKDPKTIIRIINKYGISHISATPTFYRLLPANIDFPQVKQISSGGEKLSENFKNRLKKLFPNARIRNIYASTEAGSLFASEGEGFYIPTKFKDKIRIEDNEILIHQSLLGNSDHLTLNDNWYHSGDIVQITETEPRLVFRFINRKNEMINVGGYKVNPEEIEEELLKNHKISAARVYGKPNPILGNILCADIVAQGISERDIRSGLKLQNFKIPRIINFKDKIDLTRTGKTKR